MRYELRRRGAAGVQRLWAIKRASPVLTDRRHDIGSAWPRAARETSHAVAHRAAMLETRMQPRVPNASAVPARPRSLRATCNFHCCSEAQALRTRMPLRLRSSLAHEPAVPFISDIH